jgi:CheY-like chemotaxis protein
VSTDSDGNIFQHLKNERSGVVFCDDTLFKTPMQEGFEKLGTIQDQVGLVLIVTGKSKSIPYSKCIDTILMLSLADELFEQSVFSIFKHLLLKEKRGDALNTLNPDFVKKLLSDSAHAVNNILSGMQGYAELAQLNPEDTKLIEDAFNVVIYSSYRVKQEIKNLRALVRVENPIIRPVDITDVLEESLDLAKNQVAAKKIRIKFGLDRKLFVNGDYDQLVQVFYNLLNDVVNNIGEEGTMGFSFKTQDGIAEISIGGKGYLLDNKSYKLLQRIFASSEAILNTDDEEGRIDTRRTLSICNRIIHNHSGGIKLERKGEQEIKYVITMPALEEEPMVEGLEEGYEKPVPVNLDNLDMDILVVDDEEYVRNTIYYFFDKKGCRVTVAEDGEYGFDVAKTKPFDLIFMDYLMPKMGGIEAARKIIENNREAKIVFITGRESLDEKQLSKSGIYGFIQKPFEMKDIYDIAKKVAFQKGIVD